MLFRSTGVTAYAAVLSIRKANPRKIVLAAPVCAGQTAAALHTQVDDLVCVVTPPDLGAVGLWYQNFDQTTDDEVVELLANAESEESGESKESEGSEVSEKSKEMK